MRIRPSIPGLLAAAGALGACTDNPDNKAAFCTPLGPAITVQWSCNANCTVDDQADAADGNLFSAAVVRPDPGTAFESVVLRATGVSTPGGATAGVWVAEGAGLQSTHVTLRTYLANVLQETSNADNRVIETVPEGTGAQAFLGMVTTQAFDAVEFETRNTYLPGATPAYYVFEACADGGGA